MPHGLNNWTAGAIIRFLKEHGFVNTHARGSHFYYSGKYAGKCRLVCIPVHSKSGSVAPGTLKAIIKQSGIPEDEWRNA